MSVTLVVVKASRTQEQLSIAPVESSKEVVCVAMPADPKGPNLEKNQNLEIFKRA